jgi:hypothetical protein
VSRPKAIKVTPLPDYVLEVEFNNGEVKDFDVKPYLNGDWYGKLKDPKIFSQVKVSGLSVEWIGGQDICPDELYYNSMEKVGT